MSTRSRLRNCFGLLAAGMAFALILDTGSPAAGQWMEDAFRQRDGGGGQTEEDRRVPDPDRRFRLAKAAYDNRDYRRALDQLEPLAQSGHILARYWLAQVYYLGFGGVERDAGTAAQWYARAAEGGLVVAMFKLGNMYMQGEGVARNPERAVAYFRLAADRGHADSLVLIGRFHEQGYVYEQDDGKARVWYREAARHGSLEAMRRLARNLITTDRIPRDYRRAYTWLIVGAEMGDPESIRLREVLRERFHQDEIDIAEEWARNYLARGEMPPRLDYDN